MIPQHVQRLVWIDGVPRKLIRCPGRDPQLIDEPPCHARLKCCRLYTNVDEVYTKDVPMTETRPSRPRRTHLALPRSCVEYLILADAVEALNGKLYMMGGGWDQIIVQELEAPVQLQIACGVNVPYNDTDDEHTLTMTIADPDGNAIGPTLNLTFRTGRSPNLARGAATHIPFAIKAGFIFPKHGEYIVVATIDARDEDKKRHSFYVKPAPGMNPAV
jgi:hypothetical protein